MLFDVVPTIKFEDAIQLISMQPTDSTAAEWKRCGFILNLKVQDSMSQHEKIRKRNLVTRMVEEPMV